MSQVELSKFYFIPNNKNRSKEDSCPFCNGFHPNTATRYNRFYPELSCQAPEIVAETLHCRAFVDLAPVLPGHVVITPKEHTVAYAGLNSGVENEFAYLLHTVKNKLESRGPNFIEFEHGMGINQAGEQKPLGKSVYHAHWHLIPIGDQDFFEEMATEAQASIPGAEVVKTSFPSDSSIPLVLGNITQGRPYLVLRHNLQGLVLLENEEVEVPSQFFRKMIAEKSASNGGVWNWKDIDQQEINQFTFFMQITLRFFNDNSVFGE
jgi:histidine triad (HIT) family protein